MPNLVIIENDYNDARSLKAVLDYVSHSDLIGGYGVDCYDAFRQFIMVKHYFSNEDGVQLKHFILSFLYQDGLRLDLDDMFSYGSFIGHYFQCYQMLYALHTDTDHIHIHMVLNTVSFHDGRKYADGLYGFKRLKGALQPHFPWTQVRLYQSFPEFRLNKYSYSSEDELLLID